MSTDDRKDCETDGEVEPTNRQPGNAENRKDNGGPEKKHSKKTWYSDPQNIFNGVVALFTACLFFSSVAQWLAITETNKITQKFFEMQNRPRVDFGLIRAGLKYRPDEEVYEVGMTFVLKNEGHLPAEYLGIRPAALAGMDVEGRQRDICREMAKEPFADRLLPTTLFPGASRTLKFTTFITKPELAKACGAQMKERGKCLIIPSVCGCVDYKSPFSDEHQQEPFAYRIINMMSDHRTVGMIEVGTSAEDDRTKILPYWEIDGVKHPRD